MRIGAVWGVGLVSVVLGACTQGATSERVVQHNLPVETKPAVQEPATAAAPAKSAAPTARADEPRLTSQDVEKELNRLEAELGQRH